METKNDTRQPLFRELWQLFRIFFKIGAFTIGGGYAMLPALQREFCETRKWVEPEEMLDYFAIGQCTPGIIAFNVATFVGFKRRGIPGAIASTFGVALPSIIIISVIAAFISNFTEIEWVQKALKGINVTVAVLLISAIIGMAKKSIKDWICATLAVVTFVTVGFFKVPSAVLVLFSIMMGLAFKWRPKKEAK